MEPAYNATFRTSTAEEFPPAMSLSWRSRYPKIHVEFGLRAYGHEYFPNCLTPIVWARWVCVSRVASKARSSRFLAPPL